MYSKLASAAYNNIQGGLNGLHMTANISIEQLQDDIIDERLALIREYTLKGILPEKDLLVSLNCIPVDCKSLSRCKCVEVNDTTQHFELPQIMFDYGMNALQYLGTIDMKKPFTVYTDPSKIKYHNLRRRAKDVPYVYIDITPNENNMYDAFLFNAPFLKVVTAVFIPKDPQQLANFECCPSENYFEGTNFLNREIVARVTQKYIQWYRQLAAPITPNNQVPK